MFATERRRNAMYPAVLLGAALAAGLAAQPARATLGPGHEPGDTVHHDTDEVVDVRPGPRATTIVERRSDETETDVVGGELVPGPVGRIWPLTSESRPAR